MELYEPFLILRFLTSEAFFFWPFYDEHQNESIQSMKDLYEEDLKTYKEYLSASSSSMIAAWFPHR